MNPEAGSRWGIMGGIFDPIHFGHLRLTENALEAFGLDGVFFVVSYDPPHRERRPKVAFEERLAMVEMTLSGIDGFHSCDIEKEMTEPRYTIYVVRELKKKYGGVDWYLVLGADNLAIFDDWYQPEQLLKEVKVVIGVRPGYEAIMSETKWQGRIETFNMQPMDISSTMIRDLIAQNKSIKFLLPETVEQYIIEKGLYR
jgi:nicotinate-nucleotide adenylyltransferase